MILFKWGEEKLPVANMKYGITADSMALKVGLKDGDLITKVNDKELKYFDDLPKALLLNEKNTLTVNRNGKDTLISFPPGFLSELTKNQLKNFVSVRFPNVVDSVDASKAKFTSGKLINGDKIVGIDGKPVEYFSDFAKELRNYKGKTVTLAVIRNNTDSIKVGAAIDDAGKLGYYPKPGIDFISFETRKYGFLESIPAGIRYGVNRLVEYVENLKLLFTSKEHKVSDNLGSVISIGKTFGGTWDWERFWTMTGLFSIILAFMNVLPIPALDGGHALFTLYEMITGRKPGDKFMEYAQMVGMILLLGLMAYALGLDIFRLFR